MHVLSDLSILIAVFHSIRQMFERSMYHQYDVICLWITPLTRIISDSVTVNDKYSWNGTCRLHYPCPARTGSHPAYTLNELSVLSGQMTTWIQSIPARTQKDGWNLLFLSLLQSSVCHADNQTTHADYIMFFSASQMIYIIRISWNALSRRLWRLYRKLLFHLTYENCYR